MHFIEISNLFDIISVLLYFSRITNGENVDLVPVKPKHVPPGIIPSENEIEQYNKNAIVDFYNELFAMRNVRLAADKYISATNYIEHSPQREDGIIGFKITMQRLLDASPRQRLDLKRIVSRGDLVWVHGQTSWLGRDVAFVDIFKMERGKIVEHWDVIQPLPTTSVNSHPMF